MPRVCPKCRADLASTPVRNGKLRCPECGVLFAVRNADERLQSAPAASRSIAKPQKPSALPIVLLLIGLGVGFVLLLVLGGAAAFLFFAQSTPAPTVVNSPPNAPFNPGPPREPIQAAPPAQVDRGPVKEPIQAAPPAQGAAAGIDRLPLTELKAATVYIKGQTATMGSRGSGFVLHAQGGTAYIATNHHVISPPTDNRGIFPPFLGPQLPGMPIGPPQMPGMPFGPGLPRRRMSQGDPFGSPFSQLTVVFYSGTAKEQSVPADLVGDDAANDLAILRATGVRETPRPIDYQRNLQLMETMPVVAFGFPFGEKLDLQKKNPAVTVTKGNISSLRGAGGEVEQVQLDLDLNPGNSGGPIVDERGALIGVAVAKWGATRIGFAIPVPKLIRLMQGRIDPPSILELLTVDGRQQVRIRVPIADPLGKLRSPTLLYGLANEVRMPQKGPNGWEPLAGGKSSALSIQGTTATATLALTTPVNGQLQIIAQVSYQTATGQTIHGEPRTLSLAPASLAGSPAKAPRPARRPKGEELTKLLTDLKSKDEATRQRAASILQQAPPYQRREEVRRDLQELLMASDPATRATGVFALAACDPKEAAPRLAKLLADDAPAVRQAVTNSLKELKDPRVAEAAATRLPIEPLAVLDVLKAIGPAAEKAVLPYLADQHAGGTRFWALNLLTDIGTAASLPALEAVQGPDAGHVRGVIEAIRGRLPLTAEELPGALDDLKSGDAAKRARASRRLAATSPNAERRADVVARLEWLLNDKSAEVRIAAAKGLSRWAGPSAAPLLSKQLEGFDPPLHAAVIDVLAEIKTEEAAAAIAKRLLDVHDRRKATLALTAMDAKIAEKALLPLLANNDAFARCEIVKVLADVGGRDSIASLEKLANDNNVFYSELARQALESIRDRSEDEKQEQANKP